MSYEDQQIKQAYMGIAASIFLVLVQIPKAYFDLKAGDYFLLITDAGMFLAGLGLILSWYQSIKINRMIKELEARDS